MALSDPAASSTSRRASWGLPEWGTIAAIVTLVLMAGGIILKANSDYSVLAADNRRHEGAISALDKKVDDRVDTLDGKVNTIGNRTTRIEAKLDYVIESVKGSGGSR